MDHRDSGHWLEAYPNGFIEFMTGNDDPECFEILGMFTALEAIEVHTFVSPDYDYLNRHVQSLFNWLVDNPQQRENPLGQGMGAANRFYFLLINLSPQDY